MDEADDDRMERAREATGEIAMRLMDITGPEYIRRVEQAGDALEELAVFMREEGCEPDFIAASIAGLLGVFIRGLA